MLIAALAMSGSSVLVTLNALRARRRLDMNVLVYLVPVALAPRHQHRRHDHAVAIRVSFGFILVVNAPQNMVAYGTDTFAAKDFVRTGLVLTVIAFALVMVLGATYWRWLGYV